jgi:hypothetical protein
MKILENFINFLMRGRSQNFDLEQRNYDWLKSNDIIRYDFFDLVSSFLSILTWVDFCGFQGSSYSCACICKIMPYVGPIHSIPKESFANYIWHTHSW